jgi:hypothetical protein
MIFPRTLHGENFGNGVRYRVSACRKRLRVSRITYRANTNIQRDEQAGEGESLSTLHDSHSDVFATSGAQEEAEST